MTAIDDMKVELAQHIAGTTAYTPPGTWYLGLAGGTGAATALAAGTTSGYELTGTDYARQAVAWVENGVTGVPENTTDISFTAGTGGWSQATHWFLALSGTENAADAKFYGSLNASRTLSEGDTIRYIAGALKLASIGS